MAYREFNPAAMEDYRDSTVQMFQDQRDFAESKVSQLTAKIGELDKKITELETKISDLNETITSLTNSNDDDGKNNSAISIAEGQRDTAKKDKEDAETERTNAQDAVNILNKTMEQIDGAIKKTNNFINDLLTNVEKADGQFETKFTALLGQINKYKREVIATYNMADTTLREHGYNKNINLKEQFSNTVDDFGDSTMINNFPYIPEQYIYHDGVLNERILSGIFQRDPKTVIDKQYTQITNILSDIADKEAWNNLAALINTGYAFFAETGGYQDPGRAYMQTQTFKELLNRYSIKNINEVFSSIISGKTIEQLTDYERKQLQASAVLNSFTSEWPVIMTGSGKGTPFTIEKDSVGRTSGVRINIASHLTSKNFGGDNWFISDFKNNLSKGLGDFIADNARSDKDDALGILVRNTIGNKIMGYFPGLSHILEAGNLYGDYVNQQSEYDNIIALGDLSSVLNTMAFGGTLSVGRDGQIGVDNSILGLNGANGFGVTMEAYNYYKGTHIDAESFYAGYMGQSGTFNLPTIPKDNPFLNLTNWLKEQGHNNRNTYTSNITWIAGNNNISLDNNSSYINYKNIITDPELSKQLAERLSKQSGV